MFGQCQQWSRKERQWKVKNRNKLREVIFPQKTCFFFQHSETNKWILILIKATSFCYIINLLLSKFIWSRCLNSNSLFFSLSWSIKKKALANIQPCWPHAWSKCIFISFTKFKYYLNSLIVGHKIPKGRRSHRSPLQMAPSGSLPFCIFLTLVKLRKLWSSFKCTSLQTGCKLPFTQTPALAFIHVFICTFLKREIDIGKVETLWKRN